MESLEQRERRIAQLEASRAGRQAGTVWPTPDDAGTGVTPIEIGPGRGNMQWSSGFLPTFPTALALVGARAVSFSRIYMSQPWVAAAVMRLLTWSLRVPLRCYRRTGEGATDRIHLGAGEHPLADAITNPWLGGSQASLIMALIGPQLVHGNSVTEVLSGASDAIQFSEKDWRYTRPIMPWRDSLEGWQFDVDNGDLERTVSADQVLHCKYWSPTGPIGVSPLQQLGVTIQIEDAAQRYQRALFQNGARPPSAIQASEAFLGIDPKERKAILKQLRADIDTIYGGPDNAGRPALLPPGLTWNPVGQSTVEAELINQRAITRDEIVAVYMLQPAALGIADKLNIAQQTSQRILAYTDSLGPLLINVEQTLNAQVGRDLLREPDIFVEFDFGQVLRGNRLDEIAALRDAIGTGLLTPNESRSIIQMPKADDPMMDEFYMPTNNMQPIGTPKAPNALGGQVPLGPAQPNAPTAPAPTDPEQNGDPNTALNGRPPVQTREPVS